MNAALNAVLNEHSVAYILLSDWAPSFITILIGGIFASVIIPRWQYHDLRSRSQEERKHALAEELSRNLRRYTISWNRLRSIAELEISKQGTLTEEETARKRQFVEARSASRDMLLDTLCSIEIYFSEDTRKVIDEFIGWDEKCSTARIHELPPREEYAQKRQVLLQKVHREIMK